MTAPSAGEAHPISAVAFDNRSKPAPTGVWAHRHIGIYGDDWFYTANSDAARQATNVAVYGDESQ